MQRGQWGRDFGQGGSRVLRGAWAQNLLKIENCMILIKSCWLVGTKGPPSPLTCQPPPQQEGAKEWADGVSRAMDLCSFLPPPKMSPPNWEMSPPPTDVSTPPLTCHPPRSARRPAAAKLEVFFLPFPLWQISEFVLQQVYDWFKSPETHFTFCCLYCTTFTWFLISANIGNAFSVCCTMHGTKLPPECSNCT